VLAWLTGESETFRLVHVSAGAIGARRRHFPTAVGLHRLALRPLRRFRSRPGCRQGLCLQPARLQPAHHVGHNPAGGWAIVLLLGLGILSGLSGWAIYNDIGGHWLEEVHEGLAATMLTVVIVHLSPASSPAACCMAKIWSAPW
jgi:hypothetical protein